MHALALTVATSVGRAETAVLIPVADAALFESQPGNNLGGSTDLPAGTVATGKKSRALMRFDVSGIPANATITSASLTLKVVKTPSGGGTASQFELRRVLRSWGEGSKSGSTGGAAAVGESSWNQRLSGSASWSVAGGLVGTDYATTPSASTAVSGIGTYTFGTSLTLADDVRAWVTNAASNFGWMLLSQSEAVSKSARRFGARESAGSAPSLVVQYSVPPPVVAPSVSPLQVPRLFEGQPMVLGVRVTGTSPFAYQWRFNGGPISGQTNALLFVPRVGSIDSGDYSVVVTNTGGSSVTAPASLVVEPLPAARGVVGWGYNFYGQVDLPAELGTVVAVAAGYNHSLALRRDGTVLAWGNNHEGETNVPAGLSNVISVAAGYSHSVALTVDGRVVCWGDNGQGQATVPVAAQSGVVSVAAGRFHTLALKNDGTVVAWGHNDRGQVNVPVGLNSVVAIAGGGYHSVALRGDGSVVEWGNTDNGLTTIPAGLSEVVEVAAGAFHTLVRRRDGSVVAWGYNGHGQTSVPVGLRAVSISGGDESSLAIQADGRVVGWGYNANGEIDIPMGLGGVSSVSAGGQHALVVMSGAPAIIRAPAHVVAGAGASVVLSVRAGGPGPLTYQWRKSVVGGSPALIEGATAESLTLNSITPADAVAYDVVVGNSLGTTLSGTGMVTIPELRLTTRGSGSIAAVPAKPSYLPGETVTLTPTPGRFYAFAAWSDGNVHNPRSITMSVNSATNDFVAVFTNTVPLEPRVTKQWEGTFGGAGADDLKAIRVLPDGSVLLGGTSDSGISGNKAIAGFGANDFWLVKVDSKGSRIWEKVFGGLVHDNFRTMETLADGSIVLAGSGFANNDGNRSAPGFGGVDVWLIKLDANGNKIWDKAFGGSHYDDVSALHALPGGGFMLAGTTLSPADGNKSSPTYGSSDGWLVKVDADGNKVWDQTFGGSSEDWFTSIQPTRDGGFLLGGVSQSPADGNKAALALGNADMWLVKVDAAGNKIWDKTYGGTNFDVLNAMAPTSDGGFLLGGASGSDVGPGRSAPISGLLDYWIVKVDAGGNPLWDRSYGGMSMDELSVIRPLRDGGFLLGGASASGAGGNKTAPPYGGEDYWVVRIDEQGGKLWDRSFGGTASDFLRTIEPTPEGGFILGGTSESGIGGNKTSSGFGTSDFWALKILPEEWPVGTPWIEVNGNTVAKHEIPATDRAMVTVSTTFARGHVFYTTDGTEPDAGSTEYTGPFEVTAGRTIRAVAYTEDFLTSQLADPVVISFIPLYSFALVSTGGGTVTSDWAGGLVLSNTVVTLTATPSNGWTFVGWSGDATGTQTPLSIDVRSNATVTPIFGTPLTLSTVGGGMVLSSHLQSFYPFGSKVRLSAVPDPGKFFRFWTGTATGLSNSPIELVVTNPTPSVSAVFATLSGGAFALNTLVIGEGSVTKSPQQQNYANGSTVTLTAVPSPGNLFAGWSGDAIGTTNPLEVSMTATKTVTATFVSETRGVTIRSPFDGVELAAPASVAIDVTLVDFAAERVEFFQGTTKIGETSTAPFGFLWNPAEPGSYTLTAKATDASGFSNVSKPVNVKVSIPPTIQVPPQGQAVPLGVNVEFTVVADGTPPLFYQWRTNGVDISGATSSRYALTASAAMLGSTSYTVLVTNSVGRAVSGAAVLTVSALPPQTITFEPLPDRVLDNTTLSLVATATSGLPVGFSLVSGPARLTNSTLHLSGAGTVVLRASQPGNTSFAPAQNVERSFIVTLGAAESGSLDQGHSIAVVPYASAVSDVQYAIERGPSIGAVVVNGNRLVFTPPASFYGLTDFTYRITDPVSGVETPSIRVNLLVRRVEPVYTLARSTYSAGEGDGVVTVTIHKNISAEGRVLLTTHDVTAKRVVGGAGDYALLQTFLDFGSGETQRSVAISLVDDLSFEGDEVFEFEIAAVAPSTVVAPSKATVTITDNDSALVSFDTRVPDPLPTRDARLQITLSPAGVDGGWRFLGQRQWNASGVTTDGLPEGDYEVEFKPANGFAHPLPIILGLRSARTLNHAAYYVATPSPKLGNLTVTCVGTSFGGWKFVEEPDTAYRPSGTTLTALNVGTYTIQFKPVDGLIAPGNLNVEVRFQTPQTYEGTYLVAPPSTTDRIKPSVTSLALMKYPWVGQISRGDGALGTGFVVKDRVVVTAGHVLFDQRTLSNAKRVRWHFQKQRGTYEPKPQIPRGWSLYAGYAAQRSVESGSSTASLAAQNLDAAVMFFTESAGRGGYGGYLASTNLLNEWLVSTDEKMLTGYPIDGIPSLDQGKIHETSPVPVGFAKVAGLSEGWLYSSGQLLSYPGNSGGPICVRHANGSFYPAGIFVALDADRIYARSLDSKLVDMILAAEVSSLSATNATGGGVISPGTGGGVVNLAREDMIDDYGFLRVAIAPTDAALLGGWRLVGGNPEYSQASLDPTPLITYGYEIEYKPVAGYLTPPNVSVQLVSGVTNDIVAFYTAVESNRTISGSVGYYNSSLKVPGVVMSLTGDTTATTTTGVDGAYSFTVPAGGRYTVSPAKSTEIPPVQGVSTLDITLIRRQVLGLAPLDSAFKLLAADVNGSSTVTTLDITLMRRLILGLSDTLPSGLWRFVKSDQTFPDILSPWGVEASRSYASLTSDLVAQDFIAIKSGDVNASWTVSAPSSQGLSRSDPHSVDAESQRGIVLGFPELEVGLGSEQTIDLPLNASSFRSVTSLQCSMSWDPEALELVGPVPGRLPSVSEENFNLMARARGWIAFSWDDPSGSGVSLGEVDPLFSLRFRVKLVRPGLATVFIGGYPTSIEVTANSRVVASHVSNASAWVGMKRSGLRFEIRHRGADGLALVCPPLEGAIFVVQAADDLEAPVWRAVGDVRGDASDRSILVKADAARSRFYRFLVRPKVPLTYPGALIEPR